MVAANLFNNFPLGLAGSCYGNGCGMVDPQEWGVALGRRALDVNEKSMIRQMFVVSLGNHLNHLKAFDFLWVKPLVCLRCVRHGWWLVSTVIKMGQNKGMNCTTRGLNQFQISTEMFWEISARRGAVTETFQRQRRGRVGSWEKRSWFFSMASFQTRKAIVSWHNHRLFNQCQPSSFIITSQHWTIFIGFLHHCPVWNTNWMSECFEVGNMFDLELELRHAELDSPTFHCDDSRLIEEPTKSCNPYVVVPWAVASSGSDCRNRTSHLAKEDDVHAVALDTGT